MQAQNTNRATKKGVNPRKIWATKFDDNDIGNDESFIMYGYGSPIHEFNNQSKAPNMLSSVELKAECLARVRSDPNMDPRFVALTELCVVNSAYVHTVRDCQAVKRWDTSCVTLVGDAVFKYVCLFPLLYCSGTWWLVENGEADRRAVFRLC